MSEKSEAVVSFIGNLLPLYDSMQCEGIWCARSMQDGTLILPVDESEWDEERGTVRVRWQGDRLREQQVEGPWIATLAIERYVRLHGAGAEEEVIAAELWYMARHFYFKTDCHVYLPQLPDPPRALVRAGRVAARWGEGILVNLFSKLAGAG